MTSICSARAPITVSIACTWARAPGSKRIAATHRRPATVNSDPREHGQPLQRIFGIGPVLAATILAELGDAKRFRRSRQVVRVAGLDPVVRDSADTQRRGHLAKQGAPCLRWALVEAAQHACRKNSPDHELYVRARGHAGANPATLTIARKIGKRAFHVLRELEPRFA